MEKVKKSRYYINSYTKKKSFIFLEIISMVENKSIYVRCGKKNTIYIFQRRKISFNLFPFEEIFIIISQYKERKFASLCIFE